MTWGGMPVARLAGRREGGTGHLLLITQVCSTSGMVLYAHAQQFRTALDVQII